MTRTYRIRCLILCAVSILSLSAARGDGPTPGRCCYWEGDGFACQEVSEGFCEYVGGDWEADETCLSASCNTVIGRVCVITQLDNTTFESDCHEMSYANHLANLASGVYLSDQANWTWNADCGGESFCEIGHCCYV